MKLRKKISILLLVIAVVLAAIFGFLYMSQDQSAPSINFSSDAIVYSEDMDEEELIEGVTASDSRDGDVSDSIRVSNIQISEDGKSATVEYVARDSSNNIARASRVLQANISASTGVSDMEAQVTPTPEAAEPTPTPEASATPTPTPPPEVTEAPDANELGRQENEAAIAALAPEAPRLYLSEYAITINAGSEFNPLLYVEDITDDLDARDDLYMEIQIEGGVDTATPGVYELYYLVVDSTGNSSNQANLTVTVV